jgi:hypothetical protein
VHAFDPHEVIGRPIAARIEVHSNGSSDAGRFHARVVADLNDNLQRLVTARDIDSSDV